MRFQSPEIRQISRLTFPILATQLAQIGMGTVDTVMAGNVGTVDLAAVAIGTSLMTPTWLLLSGILVALSPLTAALKAANRSADLPQLLASALWSGILLGFIALLLMSGAAYFLYHFVDDAETARIAAFYTLAVAVGMPAVGIFVAYRYFAEAQGQPAHVTRIMLTGLALNIPVNALFMYGWFGLPKLGGIGCGIGTSIVFTGMAIAMALNTRKHRLPADYPLWRNVLKPAFSQVKSILKIGIPIGAAIFFEVSLFSVIALFLTVLGPTVVAGHQIALNLSALTFMVPLSIGLALTVRVSHWLGSGDTSAARSTSWLGIRLNLGVAMFNAFIMTAFATYIARLYSPDIDVLAVATSLLVFAAIFQLPDAVQVSAAAALRAYHDTFAVMVITFISYWPIGLGLGYWLAFKAPTPYGAQGFWFGLIIGLACAAIVLLWRLKIISKRSLAVPSQAHHS